VPARDPGFPVVKFAQRKKRRESSKFASHPRDAANTMIGHGDIAVGQAGHTRKLL